jgi:putative tryptophan/tyrosine transport system substrate-binding protein
VRRREFIMLLGAAAAWPLAARAQREERMRRVAALMAWTESDPGYRSWFNIFVQRLSQLGWANGQNVRIDQRWAMAKSIESSHSLKNWSNFSLT